MPKSIPEQRIQTDFLCCKSTAEFWPLSQCAFAVVDALGWLGREFHEFWAISSVYEMETSKNAEG